MDALSLHLNRRRFVLSAAASAAMLALAGRLTSAQEATPGASSATGIASWTKFNLDTISSDEILTIPNAGDRMTREFEEYRPYTSIVQFREEIGKYVDDDIVAAYERYLFVAVDPNNADAETLLQLPGLTEDGANTLTAARPFDSNDTFLAALGDLVSSDHAAVAAGFLTGNAGNTVTWQLFNLNTAGDEQLLTIPNLGDNMLAEFKEYRPYTSITQFREEIGKYVDTDVVAAYEGYVFVPVDPTGADTETLLQLPGVTEDSADQLASAEPYATAADFLTALGSLVSAEQAANAATFLA